MKKLMATLIGMLLTANVMAGEGTAALQPDEKRALNVLDSRVRLQAGIKFCKDDDAVKSKDLAQLYNAWEVDNRERLALGEASRVKLGYSLEKQHEDLGSNVANTLIWFRDSKEKNICNTIESSLRSRYEDAVKSGTQASRDDVMGAPERLYIYPTLLTTFLSAQIYALEKTDPEMVHIIGDVSLHGSKAGKIVKILHVWIFDKNNVKEAEISSQDFESYAPDSVQIVASCKEWSPDKSALVHIAVEVDIENYGRAVLANRGFTL